jgi:hypothetical protein
MVVDFCIIGEKENFSLFSLSQLEKNLLKAEKSFEVIVHIGADQRSPSWNFFSRSASAQLLEDKLSFPIEVKSSDETVCYYSKNKKFEKISSLKKGVDFFPFEDFYKNERSQINLPMDEAQTEAFFKRCEGYTYSQVIAIEKNKDGHWVVRKANNSEVVAKRLYVGLNLDKFLELYRGGSGSDFEELVLKYKLSLKKVERLVLSYLVNGEVLSKLNTFFIPQSLSQKEGHFIGEFFPYDEKAKQQKLNIMCLLHEERGDFEKYASSKLKKMRRTINKLFPDLKKFQYEEVIDVEHMYFQKKDSLKKKKDFFEKSDIFFFGESAPLSESYLKELAFNDKSENITGLLRKMISLEQCLHFGGQAQS